MQYIEPTLETKGYTLANAVEKSEKFPCWVTTPEEVRKNVPLKHYAQLGFQILTTENKMRTEKMWVLIFEHEDDCYCGQLQSNPFCYTTIEIKRDDIVYFKPEHIIKVESPEGAKRVLRGKVLEFPTYILSVALNDFTEELGFSTIERVVRGLYGSIDEFFKDVPEDDDILFDFTFNYVKDCFEFAFQKDIKAYLIDILSNLLTEHDSISSWYEQLEKKVKEQ